ncbi:MAG: hypothetical protein RCG15_05185 [Candidatus Rickettsia vulgarisii]
MTEIKIRKQYLPVSTEENNSITSKEAQTSTIQNDDIVLLMEDKENIYKPTNDDLDNQDNLTMFLLVSLLLSRL